MADNENKIRADLENIVKKGKAQRNVLLDPAKILSKKEQLKLRKVSDTSQTNTMKNTDTQTRSDNYTSDQLGEKQRVEAELKAKKEAKKKADEDARKAAEEKAKLDAQAESLLNSPPPPIAQQLGAAARKYSDSMTNNHPQPDARSFTPASTASASSPSLHERTNNNNTFVSEVNSHTYSEADKKTISKSVEKYYCKAEFPNDGPVKISGPSTNLIQALKNCGNPELAKGPFTLNFDLDLDDPKQIEATKIKMNTLLDEASKANVAITDFTINGKSNNDNRVQCLKDKDGNIAKVMISPPTQENQSRPGIH